MGEKKPKHVLTWDMAMYRLYADRPRSQIPGPVGSWQRLHPGTSLGHPGDLALLCGCLSSLPRLPTGGERAAGRHQS